MKICRGTLKGRDVPVMELAGLRPSQGVVREALWSILEFGEKGAFVDLFSGTGMVAVEACSTGHAPVFAVEKNAILSRSIHALKMKFDLPLTVFGEDVHRRLEMWARDGAVFPNVFADPPYDYDRLEDLLEKALAVTAPGGLFILESRRPFPLEARAERVRAYGRTVLASFRRK
jgi:16S rRNA (guanine966-N2)-methyltransferase